MIALPFVVFGAEHVGQTLRGCFACLFSFSLCAETWSVESLSKALEARPEEDRARDAARQPAEVLVAAGIGRGTTVMDLASSGGWYAEVLSVAVGDEGTVYAQNAPEWLEWDNRRYDNDGLLVGSRTFAEK